MLRKLCQRVSAGFVLLVGCAAKHLPSAHESAASDSGAELADEPSGLDDGGSRSADASSDGGAVAVQAVVSYDDFCEQSALQECQRLSACCDAPGLRLDLCARFMRYRSDDRNVAGCAPELKEPSSLDLTSAATCLALRKQGHEDCHPVRADAPARRDAVAVCAKVAPLPSASSGSFCGGSWDTCDAPLGMVSDCVECSDGCRATCSAPRPRGAYGASCSRPEDCRERLTCRRETRSSFPSCAAPAADGAGCTSHTDCASGECTVAPEATGYWGSCAEEPSRISTQMCEMAQGLAQYGLFATSLDRFWVNETDVVWIDKGKLRATPKDGTWRPRMIAEGVYGGGLSALDDSQLMLDTRGTRGVMRIDLASGEIAEWLLDFKPNALVLDRGRLLVASADCGNLVRVSERGTVEARFVLNVAAPNGADATGTASLLVAGEAVYCVTRSAVFELAQGASSGVLRAGLAAADAQAGWYFLVPEQSDDRLWLVAGGPQAGRRVYTLAKGAGSLVENNELPLAVSGGFLIDRAEGALYAVGSEGVSRWSIADRTLTELPARVISSLSGFTQDARNLYWYGDRLVMRIPKH